eukprot:6292673-Alexandrium_andersonii.AAC.1
MLLGHCAICRVWLRRQQQCTLPVWRCVANTLRVSRSQLEDDEASSPEMGAAKAKVETASQCSADSYSDDQLIAFLTAGYKGKLLPDGGVLSETPDSSAAASADEPEPAVQPVQQVDSSSESESPQPKQMPRAHKDILRVRSTQAMGPGNQQRAARQQRMCGAAQHTDM